MFSSANSMTHDVIGSATEVHKDKGPGLLESIYEWCLTMELLDIPLGMIINFSVLKLSDGVSKIDPARRQGRMIPHFSLLPPFSPVPFVSRGFNASENGGLSFYDR